MTDNDGGYVVPDGVIDWMYEYSAQPSVFGIEPLPSLTGWRRIRFEYRMARYAAIGWLHDRLFGRNYCNHDGCD